MQRLAYSSLTICLLFVLADGAKGDLIRFNFTGTITSAFDNDPASNPDTIFGAVVDDGDPVTGYFSFDSSAAETASQDGLTGSASAYEQNLPYRISVEMGGVTFESDGLFLTSVVNDYTSTAGESPIDIFGTGDGVEGSIDNLTGDTILVNNVVTTGRIGLQFNDLDATAFNSTALPTLLNLADFEFSEGRINGTNSSGIFSAATFRFDSLALAEPAAVPEPSSLALSSVMALGVVAARFRRRRDERPRSGGTA